MPPLKLGVTRNPPGTALFSATVNVSESPSLADASVIVTDLGPSSSMIVPVAVSVAVTVAVVPETARLTVKVSFASSSASSVVATVNVCCSPAFPVKASAAVFAV